MTNYKRILDYSIFGFIYIPILIFIVGWCAWYISIPSVFVACYSFCKILRTIDCDIISVNKESSFNAMITTKGNFLFLLLGFILLFFFCYVSGLGRFVIQSGDWNKHNAILQDLISYEWPVIYKSEVVGERVMLTYYVLHYLPAALVGKVCNGSFSVAELFFAVWSLIGLFLVYLRLLYSLSIVKKSGIILTAFVIILFTLPLWLSNHITFHLLGFASNGDLFYGADGLFLQYLSNQMSFIYAVPQILVPWLITLVLLDNRKQFSIYVPLMLPALMFGSLAFIGIIPFALVEVLCSLRNDCKKVIRQCLCVCNILTSLTIGLIFVLYLWGNVHGEKPDVIGFGVLQSNQLKYYVLFVIFIVLPYIILLFKSYKNDSFYWSMSLVLIILPLFRMGLFNDLMTRGSIPALFVLMYYLTKYLVEITTNKFKIFNVRSWLILFIFVTSSIYPIQRIQSKLAESFSADFKTYGSMCQFADRNNSSIQVDLKYNYFTYDINSDLFYLYIARK